MRASIISTAFAVVLANAGPLNPRSAGHCTDILIPVTATANNRVIFDPTHDLTTIDGITSFLTSGAGLLGDLAGLIPQTGTYNISGRYCTPTAVPENAPTGRNSTLQVLLHGIPYNKEYWSGLGFPNDAKRYSWIDFFNAQGYPTLALDNLGKGNSSKPDGITVCQQPLEIEIVHQILQKARTGTLPQVPRADKIVYVGHSAASTLGNGIATKYPQDFDAAILTGYSHTMAQSVVGILTGFIEPASLQNASRFSDLPPTYLTFGSESGKRNIYYSADGQFDPALPAYDVQTQDTVSLGEVLTVFTGSQRATNFKGDVLLITGNQDALFCSLGSREVTTPSCGTGENNIVARSKDYFPNAHFEYFLPVGGHAITLHYSANLQFLRANLFLTSRGY